MLLHSLALSPLLIRHLCTPTLSVDLDCKFFEVRTLPFCLQNVHRSLNCVYLNSHVLLDKQAQDVSRESFRKGRRATSRLYNPSPECLQHVMETGCSDLYGSDTEGVRDAGFPSRFSALR